MEGPHHQDQEDARETAPPLSSLNPAPPVVSAEENVEAPQDDQQPVAQAPKCIDDGDDEYDRGEHEAMLSDTAKIATEALEFYNNKEGTNFVLRKPLLSWCNLFPGTLAIHANFKAKNVVDPAVPENNPPSQLFFSETLKVYRQPTRILNCLIMDKRSTCIRTGCAHCPTHICGTTFYHPPMGNSEYGEDEEKDHARFDYDESTSSSDDEE